MRLFCIPIAVLCILTACHSGQKSIKIGAIYNLTGEQNSLDVPMANGAKLAVKQINKQGGIQGRPLELILLDGKSDALEVAKATRMLINKHKVRLIIGLSNADLAESAIAVSNEAKVPFLTCAAAYHPQNQDTPNYLWSLSNSYKAQATALAEFAYDEKALRTCIILTDTSSESTMQLSKSFRDVYNRSGGWIIREEPFTGNGLNVNGITEQIKISPIQPAMLFLATTPELSAEIVGKLRKAGIKSPVLGGDAFDSQLMLDMTMADSSQVIYPSHAYLDTDNVKSRNPDFIKQYQAEYGIKPETGFAAMGFDTVSFAAKALNAVHDKKPESYVKAISEATLPDGLTGRIGFVKGAHYAEKPIILISLSDGIKKNLTPSLDQP